MCKASLALLLFLCPLVHAQTPIRVACGRTSVYNDHLGQSWAADTNTQGNTFTTPSLVKGTSDSTLFQTERWASTLTYTFTLAAGNYHVNLLESENYFTASNQRVMNVKLQGATVANAYDIFVQAKGADTAVTSGFDTVVAADGKLTLELDGIVNNAKCDGIEILPTQPSQLVLTLPGTNGGQGMTFTFGLQSASQVPPCDPANDGVCGWAVRVCDLATPANCTVYPAGRIDLLRTITLPLPQTQIIGLVSATPSP